MAGGANDERFLVLGAKPRHLDRRRMDAEVNYRIGLANDGGEIAFPAQLRDNFKTVDFFCARDERLAHPAFRSVDDDLGGHILNSA